MAAQFEHFPLIDVDDLPQILVSINMMGMARAKRVSKIVIRKFKEFLEKKPDEQVLLNRVRFAEVLLIVLKENDKEEKSPVKDFAERKDSGGLHRIRTENMPEPEGDELAVEEIKMIEEEKDPAPE